MQALYRKWRPRTFDEVYGQEHITSILKYEVANEKHSHAYLFCGSRGTGKTSCAKILAKALNCTSPVGGNPCGACAACLAVDSGAATDVLEMDAASNNGVDNIRDIRDEVAYSPSSLKYRVYIIDEVHMLSSSAFNALLKTLEEPPAHVVFILATTELHKLPATIISRCQRFDFRRIATETLKEHLLRIAKAEEIGLDEDAALLLAKASQGGMRDAISLLDLCAGNRQRIDTALVERAIGSGGRESTCRLVGAIADKDYDEIFRAVDETVSSSRDIAVFWQDLISLYRDLLIVKTSKSARNYLDLTDSETAELTSLAARFTTETLSYHCGMLEQGLLSMQRSNAVKRIVAELTLVRMCDERLSSSPEAMLSRISALEKQAVSGAFVSERAKAQERSTSPVSTVDENTSVQADETRQDVGARSENDARGASEAPQSKRAPRRAAPPQAEDDEMFRSDAPVRGAAQAAKPVSAATKTGVPSRVLKPYKSRAEVVEALKVADMMIAGFLNNAKWYSDGDGKLVLKFSTAYEIETLKMFGGDKIFLKVLSDVTGGKKSAADVSLESESEAPRDEIIDTLVAMADEE